MGRSALVDEREEYLNYCVEMLQQVAEILEHRAGEPEFAAMLNLLLSSQFLDDGAPALDAPKIRAVGSVKRH